MYNIYLTKLGNIGVGTLYLGTGAGLDVAGWGRGWGFLKNYNIKQPKLLDMTIEMNEARVIWEWIYTVCIIIEHIDFLVIFLSKHILPVPNHINLNNYYSFCI